MNGTRNWPASALAALVMVIAPHANAQQKMFSVSQRAETVGANTFADLYVQCPAGLVAYSGGLDTEFAADIDLTSSAPTFNGATQTLLYNIPDGTATPPTGWHVSARNRSAIAHPVTVMAMCASGFDSMIAVVTTFNVGAGSPANASFNGVKIACPAIAIGGGMDTQFPATMIVSSSSPLVGNQYLEQLPAGQLDAPGGWSAFVRNEGAAGKVKASALCIDLGGMITVNSELISLPAGGAGKGAARCPAGYAVVGGGFDPDNVLQQGGTFSTSYFATDPVSPARRPDGIYPGPTGWTAGVRNNGSGIASMKVGVICIVNSNALDSTIFKTVYEFYNTGLKHFFRTASAAEAAAIDGGSAGPGWVRTGDDFIGYFAGSNSPGLDVCRFYTFGANSHFYTIEAPECDALKSPSSGWTYEGQPFRILKPDVWSCPVGAIPVYRLYNNRFAFTDSNHRFTTVAANAAALEAQGWQFEGVGFCAVAN